MNSTKSENNGSMSIGRMIGRITESWQRSWRDTLILQRTRVWKWLHFDMFVFYVECYVFNLDGPCKFIKHTHTHTHTRLTALRPGLPGWAGTRKVKTNLDFTEARDSEWQWHQLDHMQVCTSSQTDNHASTPPPSFLQAGCPSNSVKALKDGWSRV